MATSHTIAVLPLEAPPSDAEQEWFARGVTEDMITELSRFPQLGVIHAHSAFSDELAGLSDRQLGAELGARYLLRGTIRRDGPRALLTTRLVDAETGHQLAAERYETELTELPNLSLDIAADVAGRLALRIDDAWRSRARRKPAADLEAYECWLKGIEELRHGSVEHDDRARALFERALERDPCFARAHAGISLSHFNEWSCQAWFRWDEKATLAAEAAARAIALDDADHVTHLILGRVELFRRNFDAARHRIEQSLQLNPNDADALVQISICVSLLGEHERAIALLDKAKRLNPKHGDWYFVFEGYPRFFLGQDEEVLRIGALTGSVTVDQPAMCAAAAALLGRADAARRHLDEFLDVFRDRVLFGQDAEPGEPLRWVLHVNPTYRAEDEERLREGLRRAGLTEDPDEHARASRVAAAAGLETEAARFRRDGDAWEFVFRGARVRLKEVKGFHDLAALLAAPSRAIHSLDLAGRPIPGDREDPVLDAEARARIGTRVADLQAELDEARQHNDVGRAEALGRELDEIAAALSRAMGLGGRSRALGNAAEKARTAVTWRIRNAIRKLLAAHEELGRHLHNSIRTGTFCSYEPERTVLWEL